MKLRLAKKRNLEFGKRRHHHRKRLRRGLWKRPRLQLNNRRDTTVKHFIHQPINQHKTLLSVNDNFVQ